MAANKQGGLEVITNGRRGVLVGDEELDAAKLSVLQLLHLPLERGVCPDVLEEAGLVVDPQLLLLLLALLVVLVQLTHFGLDQVFQQPVNCGKGKIIFK